MKFSRQADKVVRTGAPMVQLTSNFLTYICLISWQQVAVLRVVLKEVFCPSSFSPPMTKQQNKNYGTPIFVMYENLLYFSGNYLLKYTLNLQHEINVL
jgi:hypothetical protein